jgi:hypothetical protein
MSDTDLALPIPTLAASPAQTPTPVEEVLASLKNARSNRAVDQLVSQLVVIGAIDDQSQEAIEERRNAIQRLLVKTRKVAWIWANVYGFGQDDLFPVPLHGREASYLAVVQAGVILVLDEEYRRIGCYVSDDGCTWARYAIRRRTYLNPKSLYLCKIERFSPPR